MCGSEERRGGQQRKLLLLYCRTSPECNKSLPCILPPWHYQPYRLSARVSQQRVLVWWSQLRIQFSSAGLESWRGYWYFCYRIITVNWCVWSPLSPFKNVGTVCKWQALLSAIYSISCTQPRPAAHKENRSSHSISYINFHLLFARKFSSMQGKILYPLLNHIIW